MRDGQTCYAEVKFVAQYGRTSVQIKHHQAAADLHDAMRCNAETDKT